MSDRELLMKAAKAVGKELDLDRYDDEMGFIILGISRWWNPLTNDADAFRLMMSLKIEIGFTDESSEVNAWAPHRSWDYFYEDYGDDLCAATRRVITKVAATFRAAKETRDA